MKLMAMLALAAGGAVAAPKAAPPAQKPEGVGFVLRIDGRDIYFDLGRADGADPGQRVKIYRTVSALHPLTQEPVQDRFLVGEMEIAEAGEVLSRAQPDPELARLLRVADQVELAHKPRIVKAAPPPPAPVPASAPAGAAPVVVAAAPCPEKSCPAVDEEAAQFRDAWLATINLSPVLRADAWQAWLAQHPSSPLSDALYREVAALRQPARPEPPPEEKHALAPEPPPPPLEVSAPTRAYEGDPLEVVATLPVSSVPTFTEALLYWRTRGESLYRTPAQRMTRDGDGHLRARLPAEASRAPGLEYYVELIQPGDAPRRGKGDGARPAGIEIIPVPGVDARAKKERTRTGLWVDYVDWNKFKGNDTHLNVEGELLYRVLSGLHSIRMGFGFYKGYGEPKKRALEDEAAAAAANRPVQYRAEQVGYNYGFTELEFRPSENFGFIAKALTGVDNGGFGMGVEGKVRLGPDPGTNLVLASGFTAGVGNKNEITLTWDRVPGWPMAASVIVTNEPVGADYGVRLLWSIGREITDFMDVSLRVGYQLRDIKHNGVGLGLATNFHW